MRKQCLFESYASDHDITNEGILSQAVAECGDSHGKGLSRFGCLLCAKTMEHHTNNSEPETSDIKLRFRLVKTFFKRLAY